MQITNEIDGKVGKIVLCDKFDFKTRNTFRQATEALIANTEVQTIDVDFTHVSYLDSSALGMLLLLKEKAEEQEKEVNLIHCQEAVRNILDIACFEQIFTIR